MDDAIKSAFDEWKIARALLSNSIQTYLDACTTFGAVYFSPRHRPLERALIEDTLIAVESELESLAADAKMLLDVQVSLKMMRNKPTATARINTLPIEVLVDIFMQSGSYCAHENSLGSRNLTGVCAYWREVALNTPDLWTHIDVGPTAPYLMSDLFLTLSKGSQIYVHLHEPQLPNDAPTPDCEVGKAVGVLTPHIHRAHTLEMETYGYSRKFIFAILNLWLIRGSGGLSTVLRVFRPNGDHILGPDGM